MTQLEKLHPVTMAEFEAMEKQEHLTYELIDGMVLMSPRPAIRHQRISRRLIVALSDLLERKNCELLAEVDLVLRENHYVPDLMVVCDEPNLDDLKRYEKPPLIVIEIVSPHSASYDYFTKRNEYEALGIQEYWIVSPEELCVMVIGFLTEEHQKYCEGQVKSFVLPEIAIELRDIFA